MFRLTLAQMRRSIGRLVAAGDAQRDVRSTAEHMPQFGVAAMTSEQDRRAHQRGRGRINIEA